MAGLLDIAQVVKTVTINGTKVDVPGISAKGIAYLFKCFPEIRMLFTGKAVDPDRWAEMGVDMIAAIIAAGFGNFGSQEHEEAAAQFPLGVQAELLEAVIEATMPGGAGPFVERLERMGLLGGEVLNTARATTSPKASKH